ncbi:hypothetical protein VA596_31790 [Amycolatopsis sp., V23-08]|uniref:NACHT domain-containing protein n=1 Tax=Amycolatopsis heterodermiae TaxID=3110235 RepID=A0ABU5REK3_9PSEU|nr:hypothetical protein [Amycolatopsis sp., V23-08]MEA5364154.1 hypothetical protein [Amycolatopsis sp., V23-08]
MTTPGSERRKQIIRIVAIAALALLVVVVAIYILSNPKQVDAANIASGLLSPLAILAGSIGVLWAGLRNRGERAMDAQLDAAVTELVRHSQSAWRNEAFRQGITTGVALRVSWRWATSIQGAPAADDISAPPPPGTGPQPIPDIGSKPRLLRSGRLAQLLDLYRRLGWGRLVLVGGSGAGKTGTLILLLLGVMDYRAKVDAGERSSVPVPVLIPMAGWDPRSSSILEWAEASILRDHPYLKASAYGRGAVPSLLRDGRLSLFLDGFDEIPESLRAAALASLNTETGLRIVLTSRAAEYQSAVTVTEFAHAATVELLPVDRKSAAEYLLAGIRADRKPVWQEFVDRLAAEPAGNVAVALSTPLALSLTRRNYVGERNPNELFGPAEFTTPDDVGHHLVSAVFTIAYPDEARGDEARRFLVWIAQRMAERHLRDIAWWRIKYWTSPWLPPAAASAMFGLLGVLIGAVTGNSLFGVVFGAMWFLCGSAVSGLIVVRGARRSVSLRGTVPRLGVAAGLGLMFGGGVALVRVLASGLGNGTTLGAPYGAGFGALFGATSGLLIGLVGLHDGPLVSRMRWPKWPEMAVGTMTGGMTGLATSPFFDTTAQLIVAVVGGAGIMLTVSWTRPVPHPADEVNVVASYKGDRGGGALFGVIAGLFSGLGIGVGAAAALGAERGLLIGIATAVSAGVAGAVTASQVAAFRIVTAPLAALGRIPRKPMAVLADMYERQLLRQAGTLFQFRHAELQDYLTAAPGARDPVPRKRGRR